jgi:transposase
MDFARFFLQPSNPTHRQYEALRAHFVDGLSPSQAAQRLGYSPGSFRVLCHHFRKDPKRQFFIQPVRGPSAKPKKDNVRLQIIALRKQNFSIYEISDNLKRLDITRSPAFVAAVLGEEGFARLPRRRDEERTSPTSASSTCSRGDSAPASAGCFCSFPIWPGFLWIVSSAAPTFRAPK